MYNERGHDRSVKRVQQMRERLLETWPDRALVQEIVRHLCEVEIGMRVLDLDLMADDKDEETV